MTWEDMGLYWAWRGANPIPEQPPTDKIVQYAAIVGPGTYYNGPMIGQPVRMSLAVTIVENGVAKEVNRDELEWHKQRGSQILMPT